MSGIPKLTRLEVFLADIEGQCRICEVGRRNVRLLVDRQAAKDPSFPCESFDFVLGDLQLAISGLRGLVQQYAQEMKIHGASSPRRT